MTFAFLILRSLLLCSAVCNSRPFIQSSDPKIGIWDSPPTRIPSNSEVDGPLLGNGDMGATIGGSTTNFEFYIGKNDFWLFNPLKSKILGIGGLNISFDINDKFNANGNKAEAYELIQDSNQGLISFKSSTGIFGNATISPSKNILVININANAMNRSALNLKFQLFCLPNSTNVTTVYDKNMMYCQRFASSHLYSTSVALAMNIIQHSDNSSSIILAVVTNFDINSNDTALILSSAVKLASSVKSLSNIQEIEEESYVFFQSFWNQSSIELPSEPLIEEYWYKSLYVQACANRIGKFSPGLWGPWITTDNSEWSGDYTLNYNYEAPYYGMYSANHLEIANVYYPAILAYVQNGKIDAKAYNCSGVHYPGHIAPLGLGNSGDMGQHSDASFAALNFVNHYRYSYNTSFLSDNNYEVYNFLVLIADWWKCWLNKYRTTNNGYYVDYNDCGRENCRNSDANFNPAISLSYITFIFENLIEMTNDLNLTKVMNTDVNDWKYILENLSPLPIALFDDTVVLQPEAIPYYFLPGDNPVQLYGIWPGEQIGIGSETTLKQIAYDTVTLVASWDQGNAYPEMYPSAVRVGYNVTHLLLMWNSLLEENMPANGYVSMGGGGMDGSGAIIAVEMLLQSWNNNVIRLFPVYNFGSASFTHLRAVGAFLFSAQLLNGEVLSPVSVYSEQGRDCMLIIPWPTFKVCQLLSTGNCSKEIAFKCENNGDGSNGYNDGEIVCSFETSRGSTYQLYHD